MSKFLYLCLIINELYRIVLISLTDFQRKFKKEKYLINQEIIIKINSSRFDIILPKYRNKSLESYCVQKTTKHELKQI